MMANDKKDIQSIIKDVKSFYILTSMSHASNHEMKHGLQAIALSLITLETFPNEKFILRDVRNMIYDMSKTMSNEEKQLMKTLLKMVK